MNVNITSKKSSSDLFMTQETLLVQHVEVLQSVRRRLLPRVKAFDVASQKKTKPSLLPALDRLGVIVSKRKCCMSARRI